MEPITNSHKKSIASALNSLRYLGFFSFLSISFAEEPQPAPEAPQAAPAAPQVAPSPAPAEAPKPLEVKEPPKEEVNQAPAPVAQEQ